MYDDQTVCDGVKEEQMREDTIFDEYDHYAGFYQYDPNVAGLLCVAQEIRRLRMVLTEIAKSQGINEDDICS